MKKKLEKIRKQIAKLKQEETKIILKLKREYQQVYDTVKIPGVTKTTWKKKEGELHRSTIWRREKKLTNKK